jgi:hypothetical protein
MDLVNGILPVGDNLVPGPAERLHANILRMIKGWAHIGLMTSSTMHGPSSVHLTSVVPPSGAGHLAESVRRAPMGVVGIRVALVVAVRIFCYLLLTANVTLT